MRSEKPRKKPRSPQSHRVRGPRNAPDALHKPADCACSRRSSSGCRRGPVRARALSARNAPAHARGDPAAIVREQVDRPVYHRSASVQHPVDHDPRLWQAVQQQCLAQVALSVHPLRALEPLEPRLRRIQHTCRQHGPERRLYPSRCPGADGYRGQWIADPPVLDARHLQRRRVHRLGITSFRAAATSPAVT